MNGSGGDPLVQTRGGTFEEALASGRRLLVEQPAAALQQAQSLLRFGPEPRALELAAAAFRSLGRTAEAEQAELTAIKVSFAISELDDAAVAGQEGRNVESRELVELFLQENPGNLLALTMAAEAQILAWELEQAEARLRVVLGRAPTFLRAIMLMAKCLMLQARLREGIAVVEEVIRRKPDNRTALQYLAQLHAEANSHEKAAEIYGKMLEIDPNQIDLWTMQAQHLRILGRKQESIAAFRRALALDPNSGAAWWGLAQYFASDLADADDEAMQQALARTSESPRDGGPLHIALSILAERRGDHAEAFRHLAEGKALRASQHPYGAAVASANVDELIRTFTAERFAAHCGAGDPDDSPIFIIGMPRSGTTLVERILGRHSQIEASGELPIMPRLHERLRRDGDSSYPRRVAAMSDEELTKLGRWYVERSRDYRMTDKPRFIDKLNSNWFHAPLIRLMLPNARIIDLRRNALDCCWSNFKMLFAEGHVASNNQRDIASFYRDYVKLTEAVGAASPGSILPIRYEDVVEDVEGQTRRMLEFLGLEYEPDCINFHLSTSAVATPSSEQVRRPINRDSIGAAEPYRQWLGPMIDELGELAA